MIDSKGGGGGSAIGKSAPPNDEFSNDTEWLNVLSGDEAIARDQWRDAGFKDDLVASILREQRNQQAGDGKQVAAAQPKPLPLVRLPGGTQGINDTASELGKLLAVEQSHFAKGGAVVRVVADDDGRFTLKPVGAAQLASDFEYVAATMVLDPKGDIRRSPCSKSAAEMIMSALKFIEELPPLKVLSACPLLIELDGKLEAVVGYNQAGAILTQGKEPEEMTLSQAVVLLNEMLAEFQFTTPADKSRALAAIITPALVMSGLLPGRAALDLGEADDSQSGKGYRNKLTAAVYNQVPSTVSPHKAGVGSLEEAFNSALIAGRNFISLDNVRGKIDSPKIESFLTEDLYIARCAHSKNMEIDPRRVYVMFTSNKADITKDLANRSSCVRIRKQAAGYAFRHYAEGDILDHVRAHQPKYLGAVFAVVKAWHEAGKPRTSDTRHDFRGWAQTLDWIVQKLLKAAPLLDGHRETQERMTNPALNWLRDVALAVDRQGRASESLIASQILECIDEDGNIPIPGVKEGANLDDQVVHTQVLSQIGRLMKRCFGQADDVAVDGLGVTRESYTDDKYRIRYRYMVYRLGAAPPGIPF